jgi:hypothetical protein
MPFVLYLLLLLCFLLSGRGVLALLHLQLKTAYTITLSLLLGVAIASIVPFLMQLLFIPLTPVSVFGGLWLISFSLNFSAIQRIGREGLPTFLRSIRLKPFRILPYEIPFLAVFAFLIMVSVWRCYYLPPTSRDVLSGPEAIAQFAVSEHTMINSFFTIDLWSTNNQFKSPFLISLQMIYKMAGFPFGQVWLSAVFISFTVFLYHAIKEKQHPIVAGLLLLLFFMTPEMYAYTFMILYDYSNMVYFAISLYFLFGYFRNKAPAWFWLSSLLMGIATYIRSETLILALFFLPAILLFQRRQMIPGKKMALSGLLYYLPSLLLYYLPGPLWLQHYLPVHYNVGGLVNPHLTELAPLFQRYSDILTHLIWSHFGMELWGYIFFVAAILLVAEAFARDRYNRDARNWLYAMLVLYLGLGALGFALPLMNLNETTKRGLFKLLPLTVLYLANNAWLTRLSGWITRWEKRPAPARPAPARPAFSGKAAAKPAAGPNPKSGSGSPKKRRRK